MNKQEFAKVVQAWADGETIQWRLIESSRWEDINLQYPMNWNTTRLDYRIKPKDVIEHRYTYSSWSGPDNRMADVKLTFTNGKLTNAEVLND
jgi:hypothetical protein